MHHPTDRIAHTTAFVTPVVEHWLQREIAQWVHPMKDRSDDPSHHERTLLPYGHWRFKWTGLMTNNNFLTIIETLDWICVGFVLFVNWRVPMALLISATLKAYTVHKIEREREMFYLTTHSTHHIYGYMASDIWLRTILIVRKETRCRHIGYSYRLTARVLLYAPSHRQDSTYHGLCYTSWSTK